MGARGAECQAPSCGICPWETSGAIGGLGVGNASPRGAAWHQKTAAAAAAAAAAVTAQ